MAKIPYAIYVREYISKTNSHRTMLAKANMVFAVSRDVAEYLSDMVDPASIVVAYDHLNAEPLLRRVETHRKNRKRIVPFEPQHPVVGIVGRITVYKQQDLFLRSIPYVLSEVPEARFVVVGSASKGEKDYEQSVKTLAQQLGIGEKVAFMGHRSDGVEVMSELSVCCLTSDREPFPRTILEAQLLGCPVVAANSGGCVEMVEDGVTGLLFDATSPTAPQQLAAYVVRFLRDKAFAAHCAEQGRCRLREEFASTAPVRKFEEYLQVLVEKGAQGKNA
jgi:glycosyltransferase involved in cell wall biosynthesis